MPTDWFCVNLDLGAKNNSICSLTPEASLCCSEYMYIRKMGSGIRQSLSFDL